MKKIFEQEPDTSEFTNQCVYYHIYIDLLMNAIGLIINRFKQWENSSAKIKEASKKNCAEYEFNSNNYPNLNNKDFRNFIEHIDERNEKLIESNKYFGTFNVIHEKLDKKTYTDLTNPEKPQNNILNLNDFTYTILDVENNKVSYKLKTISLLELKSELENLEERNTMIWRYLNEKFWEDENE